MAEHVPTHNETATELVSAAIMEDPTAVMAVIGELGDEELRRVAVTLAVLVGAFVVVEADASGQHPLDVWSEALGAMEET